MKNNEVMEIKIEGIYKTTYEDGSSWVVYKTPKGETGYEITVGFDEGDEDWVEFEINENPLWIEKYSSKKHINSCSEKLKELICNCRNSENEMWFVEENEILESEALILADEVEELGLDEYIKFYEDGCAITIYGGVITEFLFS